MSAECDMKLGECDEATLRPREGGAQALKRARTPLVT